MAGGGWKWGRWKSPVSFLRLPENATELQSRLYSRKAPRGCWLWYLEGSHGGVELASSDWQGKSQLIGRKIKDEAAKSKGCLCGFAAPFGLGQD